MADMDMAGEATEWHLFWGVTSSNWHQTWRLSIFRRPLDKFDLNLRPHARFDTNYFLRTFPPLLGASLDVSHGSSGFI